MPTRRLLLLALLALGACDTLDHIQKPPNMTAPGSPGQIPGDPESPLAAASQASALPQEPSLAGSLWRPGSRSFFREQRARAVGDLLTVDVELDESAQLDNSTQLQRDSNQNLHLPMLFGLQGALARIVGKPIGAATGSTTNPLDPAIDVSGGSVSNGQGQIKRQEKIKFAVSSTVLRMLPNGNFVIAGTQEIRVNDELREIQIRGIIRPMDVTPLNRISWDKVAEARIIYGGRGTSSDFQRPRWGQQILDRVTPY